MRRVFRSIVAVVGFAASAVLTVSANSASAEEETSTQSETAGGGSETQRGQESGGKGSARGNARKTKGKRPSVREAEGTEAYDRFEANTVIKSRYQLNGEPLEVDPD